MGFSCGGKITKGNKMRCYCDTLPKGQTCWGCQQNQTKGNNMTEAETILKEIIIAFTKGNEPDKSRALALAYNYFKRMKLDGKEIK